MIHSFLFDLDGTLVQTETLKAESYALAVRELCQNEISREEVIQAFRDVLGKPRDVVAQSILERFDLEQAARKRMDELSVSFPWQALVQIRLQHYQRLLSEPATLQNHQCPFATALLLWARKSGYRTGLATMSQCAQASRVLDILGLDQAFEAIITRDDVERGKPDPEIYLALSRQMEAQQAECLVIEDSVSGIQAALQAGMHCLAVPSKFTRQAVLQSGLLPDEHIAPAPKYLQTTAEKLLRGFAHETAGG
jgi:HAD superfamily hydrolase (TIGR01509 family)